MDNNINNNIAPQTLDNNANANPNLEPAVMETQPIQVSVQPQAMMEPVSTETNNGQPIMETSQVAEPMPFDVQNVSEYTPTLEYASIKAEPIVQPEQLMSQATHAESVVVQSQPVVDNNVVSVEPIVNDDIKPVDLDTVTAVPENHDNSSYNSTYSGEINPSAVTATMNEVMGDKPLSNESEIPETFSMADFYKPNVDFSKKEEPVVPVAPVAPVVSEKIVKPKKKKKGLIIGFIILLVVIAISVGLYFIFFNKDDKKVEKPAEEPQKETPWNEQRKDWDPTTSKIKEVKGDTLTCTKEETSEGMTNKIVYKHTYVDGIYSQVMIEDEMIFNEDTIKYYDYYSGAAQEEVEYQTETYDNITIEVREKKISVSLAYAFDLTASIDNPKNMLDDKDLTKDEMKLKMENLGFSCK